MSTKRRQEIVKREVDRIEEALRKEIRQRE
jgi:hypothetical protein